MLMGGLTGFTIGIAFGSAEGGAGPETIVRASIAALIAGVLMRWWGRVWIKGLESAYREKRRS